MVGPREQVFIVFREIAGAIRRVSCECANRIERGPPAQGDDFTAGLVDVAQRHDGAEIAGGSTIFNYSGAANVFHIGLAGRAADFGAPFSKNAHTSLPVSWYTSKTDISGIVKRHPRRPASMADSPAIPIERIRLDGGR